MSDLTEASERVLSGLIELFDRGKRPTFEELGRHIGRTLRAVQVQVAKLQEAGYVARDEGARGLRPLLYPDRRIYGTAASYSPGLTRQQRDTLAAAMRATESAGGPVTSLDVARQLGGLAPSAAEKRLAGLVAPGYVTREGARYTVARHPDGRPFHVTRERAGPRLVPTAPPAPEPASPLAQLLEAALELAQTPDVLDIPVLGSVAAGRPVVAVDDDPARVEIPASWARAGAVYALTVTGSSMTGDGILDGDVLLVRSQAHFADEPDGIYVVHTPAGAVVKRIAADTEEGRMLLVSSNASFGPTQAPEGSIVQGRVIRVLRDLE